MTIIFKMEYLRDKVQKREVEEIKGKKRGRRRETGKQTMSKYWAQPY